MNDGQGLFETTCFDYRSTVPRMWVTRRSFDIRRTSRVPDQPITLHLALAAHLANSRIESLLTILDADFI
jgi:hypothetical protein